MLLLDSCKIKVVSKKTFDKVVGVIYQKSKKGTSKVKLQLRPNHLNSGGIAHGGMLATLCDVSLAAALGTVLEKSEWCLTVHLNIEFMNPAFPKDLIFGYGRVVKKGKSLAFLEGGIRAKDGRQIARAHGIWAVRTFSTNKMRATKALS